MARHDLAVRSRECEAAVERASLGLDGALDEVGRGRLARHLAGCPDCASLVEELGAFTTIVRAAPLEPYRYEQRRTARRAARVAPWAATAASVAVLVVGIASLPYATGPEAHATLTAADLATPVQPVRLPIGQRSAAGDFLGPPVVLEA